MWATREGVAAPDLAPGSGWGSMGRVGGAGSGCLFAGSGAGMGKGVVWGGPAPVWGGRRGRGRHAEEGSSREKLPHQGGVVT